MTTTTFLSTLREERATIERLTVYHLGRLITSYAGIAPEALETHELTRVYHETGDGIDRVLALLGALEIGPENGNRINARWGFVFEAADGARVGAAYLDRFGSLVSDGERTYAIANSDAVMEALRATYGQDGVIE
jgi:hypothetical protein